MKVWIVNHYALPPDEAGGTRHYTLAKELKKLGHEPYLIASSFDHAKRKDRLPEGSTGVSLLEERLGIPFLWVRTPGYQTNDGARAKSMLEFGRAILNPKATEALPTPDIILGSSPHLFAALAAQRLAKRYRVPFVMEIRDLWPQSLIDLAGYKPTHPIVIGLGLIEKYLYRKAARIVTLLPKSAEYIASHGGSSDKIVWIPNGVDFDLAPTQQQPIPPGTFDVMYAGAHGVANGLDTVLDAAARLKDRINIRFRLIGDGPEKARLVKRAADEGLTNVVFQDPVPKRDIYKVYTEASVFMMNLKESPVFKWGISPNKLWDYMLSARPVIFAVNSSNTPVGDAGCGVEIQADSGEALAEAIVKLKETPLAERMAMGLRGRQYVEQNHAFTILGKRLEEALKGALAEKRR